MADTELTFSTIFTSTDITDTGLSWRPIRTIMPIQGIVAQNELAKSTTVTATFTSSPSTDPSGTGAIPEVLLSLAATESPAKQQDRVFSLVSVSFTRDPADGSFASVDIWFTGYKGNTNPQLMTSGTESPISFLCETTGETVVVTGQTVGTSGATADLSFALTTTVALDGVVSAPPAPSIAQTLVTTPTGLQFAFNQEAGLLEDVIQCYKVYHNTANNSSTATVYQTFPQDPKNAGGQVVVSETLANGTVMYYWVSAVNTSGLESSLTAVSGGGIPSGLALTGDNLVRNGDFSAGLANWTAAAQSSEIIQNVSGLPAGTSQFKSSRSFNLTCDDFIPVDVSKMYLVSCWFKLGSAGAGVQYGGILEYDSTKTAFSHNTGGSFGAYTLFGNMSKTTNNTWQYFAGIIGGPTLNPGGSPAPTQYQFASGAAYIKPLFLVNQSGTAQQVEITNIRISALEAVSIQAYLKATGINLMSNSDFHGGSLSFVGGLTAYSVYDNNATGHVAISTETDSTAPNSSGYRMKIVNSGGGESPGYGGFCVAISADSGTLAVGSYHKGNRILVRIKAKIPDGYSMYYASNPFGNEGTTQWITDTYGRGVWRDYLLLITIGTTGTFSSIGFFYIDGSTGLSSSFTWYVASFEMIDIDQVQMTGNTYQLYNQGVSSSLLTQGSIIPTQAFTISYTTTSTTISLSWSNTTLYRADGSTFTVASGSKSYTGLSASNTYYLYPYIDLVNLVIAWTNPNPPGTSLSSTLAVQTQFDTRSGLSAMVITTPASGSGGGTGGDGGQGGSGPPCPEQNELVEVQRNGQVIQIKVGDLNAQTDLLKGYSFEQKKDVYRRVLNKSFRGCAAWRIVNGHKVTPCEPVYVNDAWIPAYKAPGATIDMTVGVRVDIVVKTDEFAEHNYYLVGGTELLIHNFFVLPC
jgi:hypothetical protein